MYRDFLQEIEEKEAVLFKEKYTKQVKLMKKIFFVVFGGLGFLFASTGVILFLLKIVDEEGFLFGLPFLIIGGVFLIIGLSVGLALPNGNNIDYQKMKEKMNKNGGAYIASNSLYLSTIITVQTEQIKELSIKISQLEDDLRRFKNERRA